MNTKALLMSALIALTGCSSTTTQYYEAVTATAQANAAASQARFDALSAIAAAGDGQAASAAVMALALTQTPTIAPVPQQSQAIQWASVLAAPLTSLGMAWVQADTSKAISQYQAQVDMERIRGNGATQQALYGTFADMSQGTVDVATAGLGAAGSAPDYSDFINGMITLGTAGITGAVDLGIAGFGANTDIATAGINGLVDLGNAGITGVVDIGNAGITGVTTVSSDAFSTILDLDTGNNSLLDGLWTNYTTSIQDIIDGVPRVCQTVTDANGVTSIVCE